MARSKEQWKAQQLALQNKTQSKNVHNMKRSAPCPPNWKPSVPLQSSSLRHLGPNSGTSSSYSSLVAIQTQAQRPSCSSSSQVIDLTLDEDEDEEDEPMEPPAAPLPVTTSPVVSSVAPDTSKSHQLEGIDIKKTQSVQQEATKVEMSMALAEDVESDVDEEWPILPAASGPPVPLMSINDQDESRESVKVTLNDKQDGNITVENDEVETSKLPIHLPPLCNAGENEMETTENEELPHEASNVVAANLSTTSDQVDTLEDGEIFEERETPIATIQLKRPVLNCGPGNMRLVGEREARTYLRNKKQKKRGKKKTKRKLDAMQMMPILPGELHPEFERTGRQRQVFVDPQQYSLEMTRKIPRSDPMGVHHIFQDTPPTPVRAGAFQQPHMSQQRLYPSPAPLYGNSQILRVNRQGSMEMFKGGPEPPIHTISSLPMHGGFKYRQVSISSSPSMAKNGPGFSLQPTVSSSSRLSSVSTPIPDKSINSDVVKERVVSEEFDLDSLRAAALRTKAMRSQKTVNTTIQSINEAQQPTSSLPSSKDSAPSVEELNKSKSPEIDELRLEIIRSMERKRNLSVNAKALNKPSPPKAQVSEADAMMQSEENRMDQAITDNSSASQANLNVTKGLSDITLSDTPTEATIQSIALTNEREMNSKQQQQADRRTACVELAEDPKQTEDRGKESVPTPEFRPLTASSQSLVIQLNSEDFLPRNDRNDTGANAALSSSLQHAIKEMRRKIAEREKEQINRSLLSAASGLSKGSSSSLSSSSSSVPKEKVTHSISSQVIVGGSLSTTENVEELSTSNELETELCAPAEVKKTSEQVAVLASEFDQFSATKAVEVESSAAASQLSSKPALELQSQGVTSGGGSMITDVTDAENAIISATFRNDEVVSGDQLDFNAIRAEYEQCVSEYKEAERQIVRLSNEMAHLEQQLAVGSSGTEGS